jgi:hypothetical protein
MMIRTIANSAPKLKPKRPSLFTFLLFTIALIIFRLPNDALKEPQLRWEIMDDASVAVKNDMVGGIWNGNGDTIRSWGCHRTETPLIFVHIGKAGGGSVRTRFAAAALDHTREDRWRSSHTDNHCYPVSESIRAKFSSSAANNFVILNSTVKPRSYEGNSPCNATTPLGMAIACPQSTQRVPLGCRDLDSEGCHTVYVGHNYMGTELHWLTPKYLQKWWSEHWSTSGDGTAPDQAIRSGLDTLGPANRNWCAEYNQTRPEHGRQLTKIYFTCMIPIASRIDTAFDQHWHQQTKQI